MNNSIVSKYIDKIAKKTGDNSYIYRGQSQNYDGDVTSTALRRFHKSGRVKPSKEEYFEYHKNLINDAKSYHYGEKLNDTELLIDLQHYGAATGLIDFSEDFLVALWFACNNTDEDGKVFFLNVWSNEAKYKHLESGSNLFKEEKNYEENLYYLHTNFKNNNRIFAQKGVFIFGYKDINTDLESITINKNDKQGIRQELKKYFNIEEKTLFQDIYGFAQVNNTEHKINIQSALDYFEKAYEEENSEKQINLYQKAIEIKPDYYWAYNNMGIRGL
ncbi:MAG: hypothetical protein Ctma_1174 [Catillopecten margaritatus gill symbiont]|uniref:FRG domain-containing protein n=1 Tax=Catillopecten margaritatus gill symbiont TaxID=3083288 RepID=A0AAU6PHK1_9GAMM